MTHTTNHALFMALLGPERTTERPCPRCSRLWRQAKSCRPKVACPTCRDREERR